jgi:hypothetical protein
MKRSYTSNTVNTSPTERSTILNGILSQSNSLEWNGYKVWVNIFAQNKFSTGEWVDWSYITNSNDNTLSDHESVLKVFLQSSKEANIQIGLFDE